MCRSNQIKVTQLVFCTHRASEWQRSRDIHRLIQCVVSVGIVHHVFDLVEYLAGRRMDGTKSYEYDFTCTEYMCERRNHTTTRRHDKWIAST